TLAARVGQFIAFLLGAYGFLSANLLLMIVAVFVYFGAGQEAAAFQAKTLVMGHRVREAMMREFRTLPVGATLREAADLLLAGSQQDFPILHGGEAVGVLSRSALLRGIAAEGYDSYVAGIMQRDFARVQPDDDLETVLSQGPFDGPILVLDNDGGEPSLVGLLTQENLIEFLTLTRLQRLRRSE
ncbi:MAG TPA: CBS domain-containing protein, partial [Chthonomonadaceae bacterium]|nr:CBS domain-containing protein [Chthonomonadaceae bacterium]